MKMRTGIIAAVATAAALAVVHAADAQSLGDRLKKKAKEASERAAERRAEQAAGDATDKAIDKAANTVKCAASDKACQDKAKAEGKTVVTDNSAGGSGAAAAGGEGAADAMKPGQGAWANYDFKPGDRVIFAEDFTKDEVGDFPRRMEFHSGAMETVEWNGGRWLRATNTSEFTIPLPETLTERFTMEFDYALPAGAVWIWFGDDRNHRVEFHGNGAVVVYNQDTKVNANGEYEQRGEDNKLRHARILADGKYAKVYLDDKRILNVPNADLGRSNKIELWADANTQNPALFGNFRIAAGGKKLYDALAEKGRVATQGIYFDVGSDRIRPESTPTLKEIGQMLKEHPDLKLTIEGHTDNVGGAASNQALSEKRAQAVRQYLVSTYGVEDARLSAKGFGATKPVAPNDTPEGRQQNRRVELVKM